MAKNTSHLGLYKKDPETDRNDTFNIETMLNENWDKIDDEVAKRVIKKEGKGLSTNDYTDSDKQEVDKIKDKARKEYVDERVKTPVPKNAVFKDTTYTGGKNIAIDEFNEISVTGQLGLTESEVKKVKVNAAKDADTVGGHTVAKNVPADANFNDTIVDISGKVDKVVGRGLSANDYTDAEKRKVSDTATEIAGHKSDKTNPHSVTKDQVGLSNVTNNKQASEADFNAHTKKKATQTELGHLKLSDIPKSNIATMEDLRLNSKGELEYNNGSEWVPADWLDADDKTDSPGPKMLVGGTMQAGFFGVVPASELFTGSEIASAVGITEGTAQFDDVGWLKIASEGKVIFKSQKAYRHSISWDHINSKEAVDGTKKVTKGGVTYAVRLIRGGNGNTNSAINGPKDSEWNKVMLPIHERAKDQSWNYKDYVDIPTEDWGVGFTDANLHTHNSHGNGTYQWCQDVYHNSAYNRVCRGNAGASSQTRGASSNTHSNRGWSPILEVIP